MPIRICIGSRERPRCGDPAIYRGRCRLCSRSTERTTHPNKQVYNSTKHRRTRERQLFEQPLCAECGAIAEHMDHIVPIEQGGEVWDRANHQSLCAICHGRKTAQEMRATA